MTTAVAYEQLTCGACERDWFREVKRGRKPKTCPSCHGAEQALMCGSCGRVWTRRFRTGTEPAECPTCAADNGPIRHTVPFTRGVAAYLAGCRCDACDIKYQTAIWALDYYLDDVAGTLEGAGVLLGVTRERARQVFDMILGGSGAAARLKRARDAERAALQAELDECAQTLAAERDGVTCGTCGRPHHRRHGDAWGRTCSPECAELYGIVRYLNAEDWHEHQRCVARWSVKHRDRLPASAVRNAERVLAGEAPTYEDPAWRNRGRTRWLLDGSQLFDVAVRAHREGWPAFATWPEDVQKQIREYVAGQTSAA